ncbi:MAG: hypothetical protein DRP94_00735 [Candidatus Latescibacterota bacterium]|nr:MAG: hypothetical protein DRP94_00735 [Candidatus Latescibacterota bacterium]RKY74518.1 MAG: hypothetical protein DRQ14_01800 [Candidatus Latescibacterota bacterium]HDI00303.1 hypothetical protein [Bacillota bacterium]
MRARDGAEAHSEVRGVLPTGTLGHAVAFSFDSEKTMGSDVGGCVVTNDDELAERIRFVGRSRGPRWSRTSEGNIATHTACPSARPPSAWPSLR